jgi:uncharacterized membrane protein (DUF373 family)
MNNFGLASIITFVVLFLGICCFAIFCIALLNIYTKSYRPQHSLAVIAVLLLLFVTCSLFELKSITTVTEHLNNSLNNLSRPNNAVPGRDF